MVKLPSPDYHLWASYELLWFDARCLTCSIPTAVVLTCQTNDCEALCNDLCVCVFARCVGEPMEKPSSSGRAALEEGKSLVEVFTLF